jgi:uncharacterized protein (TIGR03083 family)
LAETLSSFDDQQWAAPSRCAGWSARDVVAHLAGTNVFWTASITAGLAGAPTRFLTSFDPVGTPAAMVTSSAALRPSEVLGQFVDSTDALADAIGSLDAEAWLLPAEAPPGHVAIHAVALHALWDSWIHERDILIPLGIEPTVEADEVAASLLYAAALGPAYRATAGSERVGTFGVAATDLDVHFLVDVGPAVVVRDGDGGRGCPRLAGPGVVLTESLSCRGAPPALAAGDQWMIEGLATVFDLAE